VHASLCVPAKTTRSHDERRAGTEVAFVPSCQIRARPVGVQVHGHVELLSRSPPRVVLWPVKEVPVAVTVDQGAHKPVHSHGSAELGGCFLRVAHGSDSEPGKTCLSFPRGAPGPGLLGFDGRGELVVGGAAALNV
jgi:hypothetical protein